MFDGKIPVPRRKFQRRVPVGFSRHVFILYLIMPRAKSPYGTFVATGRCIRTRTTALGRTGRTGRRNLKDRR